jgi:hypothetical protein
MSNSFLSFFHKMTGTMAWCTDIDVVTAGCPKVRSSLYPHRQSYVSSRAGVVQTALITVKTILIFKSPCYSKDTWYILRVGAAPSSKADPWNAAGILGIARGP